MSCGRSCGGARSSSTVGSPRSRSDSSQSPAVGPPQRWWWGGSGRNNRHERPERGTRSRRENQTRIEERRERVSDVKITAGPFGFMARWERDKSPKTCEAFERLLPYRQKIIHVRWSGESCWIPLGDYDLGVGFEDATSVPQAGGIPFFTGGCSETEILFPYSGTIFASKLGQLAGNHFLTVVEGQENLRALGELTLWEGAQDIVFERVLALQPVSRGGRR